MKKTRLKFARWATFVVSALCLMEPPPALALSFGSNLITNAGAEAGVGSTDGSVVTIPKWKKKGNITVVQYDAPDFVPSTSSGPKNRGKNFFAGGPDNQLSKAIKIIDVSSIANTVNGNGVAFKLSGYFGGYTSQNDNAVLSAIFLNTANEPLNQVSIGSVLAVDRANQTGLLFRKLNGVIPAGTHSIKLVLVMTRSAGSYNDGYADSLSLVLTESIPLSNALPDTGH